MKKTIRFYCYVLLSFLVLSVVYCSFMDVPSPIVYTGNGNTAQVGFIVDINNDGLLDFVLSYVQRDFNIAVTTVFLNNGCGYVRHFAPEQPVQYCRQYFINKQMMDWEANPPIVNLTIPSQNFTGILQLPYHPEDIPTVVAFFFGVKIVLPKHGTWLKQNTPIQYTAIRGGDEITYRVIDPPNVRNTTNSQNQEDYS